MPEQEQPSEAAEQQGEGVTHNEPAVFKAGRQFKARSGVDGAVHQMGLLVCRAHVKPS